MIRLFAQSHRKLPHTRNRFYNAPLLLMLGPSQKRLIAALLPFSFLWVFMACVSMCERETLAIHASTNLACSTEMNVLRHVRDCDGCPLSLPKATTPERTKSPRALASLSSFTPVSLSIYSAQPNVFRERLDRALSNGSPPLQPPASLRI